MIRLSSLCMAVLATFVSASLQAQIEIDKPVELTGADGERKITNLELPVAPTDAASKEYVDASSGGGFTHYVGELYQGGIVVYVWKEAGVEKGLIASLTDIPTSGMAYTMDWSAVTSTAIGAGAQSLTNGQTNTTAILAQSATPNKAAAVCDAYVNPDTGTGVYSDWYLPAKMELDLCYGAYRAVNFILGASNGFQATGYWTSTEQSATRAWQQDFATGRMGFDYGGDQDGEKYRLWRVRAVRRF